MYVKIIIGCEDMTLVDDLKIIRKKYGENMAHFCRDNFSSLLEERGLLSKILLEHFHESHLLYDDIIEQHEENDFKNYIYGLANVQREDKIEIVKSPEELMDEAGYILKECYTEEEIQEYKKYYAPGEELCTFRGGRLDKCRVFFAYKKNVDEIKREDFKKPMRQDEYGTSVISIQFTRDGTNTLSIKNRYNHKVINPDATFSNDLDNIIAGLTDSFEQYKNITQKNIDNAWYGLSNYVMANDGKFYKYNYEIFNIYFCPDNIIIDNFEVKKYDKSRYLVMDYYILDMAKLSKGIRLYNVDLNDSFVDTIKNVSDVEVENIDGGGKRVVVANDMGESLNILLNQNNQIVGLKINGISMIGNNFMHLNRTLLEIDAPSVVNIKDYFLPLNEVLEKVNFPGLVKVGKEFLNDNMGLEELNLPLLEETRYGFMQKNINLRKIGVPKLEIAGSYFLSGNEKLQEFDAPYLKEVGWAFLKCNQVMKELNLPNLVEMGAAFMSYNNSLISLSIPKLTSTGTMMLERNTSLEKLYSPELVLLEANTLRNNKKLSELYVPKLTYIKYGVLEKNKELLDMLVSQMNGKETGKRGIR